MRGRTRLVVVMALALIGLPALAMATAAAAATGLPREEAAQAYQRMTADTVAATEASNARRDRAWAAKDPVLIDEDMRAWVEIRIAARRDLQRADFLPADVAPLVTDLIRANTVVIRVYDDAIASLESGGGISAEQHRAMGRADISQRLAGDRLRAALGLPSAYAAPGAAGTGGDDAYELGTSVGTVMGPLILIGLIVGAVLGANALVKRHRGRPEGEA